MAYRPIKSLPQYKSYESYLEKLLWNMERSPAEQQDTDLLISLIKEWDEKNGSQSSVLPHPVPVDKVKILEGLMKDQGINASALATELGMSQSGISDLLNYRTDFTREIIMKISKKFGTVL